VDQHDAHFDRKKKGERKKRDDSCTKKKREKEASWERKGRSLSKRKAESAVRGGIKNKCASHFLNKKRGRVSPKRERRESPP